MRPHSTSRLLGCGGRSPALVIRPSSYARLGQTAHLTSTNAVSDNRTCNTSQGANEKGRAPGDSPAVSRRTALCMTAGLPLVLTAQAALATEPAAAPTVLPERESKLGFVERVREFTLSNGLHFIVLPRTTAPVVSVHILADVGAYQEEEGSTGLAHLLEHMAFKGTRRVGARDWAREAPLLDAMDEVFYELRDLKSGAQGPVTAARVALLTDKLKQLQVEADALVVPNAYGATLSRAGGVGLNASTSQDETRYFVSLPSNKVELWFALEAERFRAPVFRELYSEKKVIEEERRMRVDNAPLGKFQQEFAARSLTNNYRRPVIGLEEDFDKLGRREVANFFAQHYGPRNLTIALVGDVTPEQVEQLATRYWGGWQGYSTPSVSPTSLPITSGLVASRAAVQSDGSGRLGGLDRATLALRQDRAFGGRFLAVTSPSQGSGANSSCVSGATPAGGPCYADSSVGGPLVMLGFPRPPMTGPDGATISVMSDLLSGSRTSRLAGRLVLQERRLRGVRCAPSYPGDKYDGMVLLAGVPLQGGRPEEAEKLILDELERFTNEGPTQAELARVQKSTKTGVLASALSNSAMASLLASYHTSTGSWRGLLAELEEVAEMKPEGVQAVSQRLLSREKMFTGYVYAKA